MADIPSHKIRIQHIHSHIPHMHMHVQVLREFKLPEGASSDDMDANGDGEVLAVLDLGTDESLVEAGLAREVVNRVQKLRKKAGLMATDVVEVYLDARSHCSGLLTYIVLYTVMLGTCSIIDLGPCHVLIWGRCHLVVTQTQDTVKLANSKLRTMS